MPNDYSGDTDCVCNFRFENNLTDQKGRVPGFTDVNTIQFTPAYKKDGLYALLLTDADNDLAYCPDANLPADFPGKNGGAAGSAIYSVSVWSRPVGTVNSDSYNPIVSKYDSGSKRTWQIQWHNSTVTPGSFEFIITVGYQGVAGYANNTETITVQKDGGGLFVPNNWYHIVATYNGPTKGWTARIRDEAGTILVNQSGVSTNAITPADAPFILGDSFTNGSPQPLSQMGQMMDDLAIWKRILSATDADKLFAGTYGASTFQPALIGQPYYLIGGGY